jgi:hypothetical protein
MAFQIKPSATVRMKALVVARLMMGDFQNWDQFKSEIAIAHKVSNRRTARSVMSQIGRNYSQMSTEIEQFIERNFINVTVAQLAALSDSIEVGIGLSMRLAEFETSFFALAPAVKERHPAHCHIRISFWGLQFEYPEMHFLNDLHAGLEELKEVGAAITPFAAYERDPKSGQTELAALVSRERFICRSLISASFSLMEAYLSGVFHLISTDGQLGDRIIIGEFKQYAATKESAPLKARMQKLLSVASNDFESVEVEPFRSFIETGKRYRDAIHHTSPFERKDVSAGGRLMALYELDDVITRKCVAGALLSILKFEDLIWNGTAKSDTYERCLALANLVVPKVR